jgi:hypothetical protein
MSYGHRIAMGALPAAMVVAACSSTSNPDAADASSGADGASIDVNAQFVPQIADFTGFCNWQSSPATAPGDASDGVHAAGPLTVYWNHSPPHGATEFPVGTIIVKESSESDPKQRTVFAMVKRESRNYPGATYNGTGAKGWEWWSLQDQGDCSMTELWRGLMPVGQETYSGTPAGDCNGCHGQVVDNDYVWDTRLQLSSF